MSEKKAPKKQEEHMQKLQGKLSFAYTRWWKKAQVEKGRRWRLRDIAGRL